MAAKPPPPVSSRVQVSFWAPASAKSPNAARSGKALSGDDSGGEPAEWRMFVGTVASHAPDEDGSFYVKFDDDDSFEAEGTRITPCQHRYQELGTATAPISGGAHGEAHAFATISQGFEPRATSAEQQPPPPRAAGGVAGQQQQGRAGTCECRNRYLGCKSVLLNKASEASHASKACKYRGALRPPVLPKHSGGSSARGNNAPPMAPPAASTQELAA